MVIKAYAAAQVVTGGIIRYKLASELYIYMFLRKMYCAGGRMQLSKQWLLLCK